MLGAERQIDTGPLWFVRVLLVFSTAYAGWATWQRKFAPGAAERAAGAASGCGPWQGWPSWVAISSFLVRLVYPYGSESGFTDLNLWEWPACGGTVAVGVVASREGWSTRYLPGWPGSAAP